MRFAVWILGLFLGCPSKDTSSGDSVATDDSADSGDSGPDDSGGGDCATGSGIAEGVLIGSDGLALGSGKVTLYDSSGSTDLSYDNVDAEGNYHIPYGKGTYLLVGQYSSCISEDVPVTLCGGETVYKNITLTCAP